MATEIDLLYIQNTQCTDLNGPFSKLIAGKLMINTLLLIVSRLADVLKLIISSGLFLSAIPKDGSKQYK